MATTKTKGTSKKIKELKGIKPEKITDEHLKEVQELINTTARYQVEIGQLETRKYSLLNYISKVQKDIESVRETIKKEYGTDDINIDSGIINYPTENGETDKKD
jgi:FtsZ-binding cell division protein ZapB